ncbi:MAG: hypothetical protein HY049_17635 [Acidobacteria bacterium]|nr:hypothetical protein [Acidobacteriota bacterium]
MKEPVGHPIPMNERGDQRGGSMLVPALATPPARTSHHALAAETTCSACPDDAAAAELGYRLVLRCTTSA